MPNPNRLFSQRVDKKAEKKAKRLISIAIQRFAGEQCQERAVTAVELPSDDMKGRIIFMSGDLIDEEKYEQTQEYTRTRATFGVVESVISLVLFLVFWCLSHICKSFVL